MALSQSIIWTTLPRGRVTLPNGRSALRVSVAVSPRLTPTADEVLKPFETFLHWPDYVAAMRFKLVFGNGAGGELTPVPGEDPLDPDLWKRLFDAETFVRAHTFTDLKNTPIRAYPATDVYAYLNELYSDAAVNHGAELPPRGRQATGPIRRLQDDLGPLADPHVRKDYEAQTERLLKESKVLPYRPYQGGVSEAQQAFLQARRFYDRPKLAGNTYRERPDPAFTAQPVKRPKFDFHQALAALADYPRLQRRLGLVLDLAWVPEGQVPPEGRVRVEVAWGETHRPPSWHEADSPPWTAYWMDQDNFHARSADGAEAEGSLGLLDLRKAADAAPDLKKPAPYLLAQVDVDGTAMKAMHTAATLVRMERPQLSNYKTPNQNDLAALRSTGLALYRRDRANALRTRILRSAEVQTTFAGGTRPTFFAEDLVRGYRIDIWDEKTGRWHSLCEREGLYRFMQRGSHTLSLRDEGYLKSTSAARGEPGTAPDLYLHERLATFDGWSLVAARPGRTLDVDPTAPEPVVPKEDAATAFGLATHFTVPPGTLPRLRFGRRYRLRVRLVDLAGNSHELETAREDLASPLYDYVRYEPVPSPVLLLRARVTEGESLEHLVIRSDFDRTTTAWASDPQVTDVLEKVRDRLDLTGSAREGYRYEDVNERHVAPPKTSQLEAETHGKFDAFMGPGADHARGYRLAQREAGTFLSRTWVNLDTGAEEPIPGADLELVAPTGAEPTDLDDPSRQPGDALQAGEYVLHKEEQLIVPYLPDPFAAGVVFVGLPGWPANEPYVVLFSGDWPNVAPIRLRLAERAGVLQDCDEVFAGAGEPQWDEATRVLTVFQAKAVMTRVRYSSLLPSEAEARQMGLWKWIEQRGAMTDARRKLILAGRHWMFTPWRTLTLVHAVQHPLCAPTIRQFSPSRRLGDTHVDLRGLWHLSIKSTDKIDLLAAWQEPLDDPEQPTWQVLDRSGHVTEMKMNPLYPDELEVPPPVNPLVPRAKLPLRHEFRDTKHRIVRYRLKGTTRFREYFPVELTHDEKAITREGAEYIVNVPSSARPAAPQPLYILPTFQWEEQALPGNGVLRRRRGNGLRVYLDRPWWSSGESERLGVVFKTGTIDAQSPYKPYVTQWGLDPVFDSPAPASGPTMAAFPLATATRSNVSLQEIGDQHDLFAVAGHNVEFDPERRLWFSDIVVQAGSSYFPFIRLALARFQPFSIEDAHLSRVVLTDYLQLVPDRTLDARWVDSNTLRVRIYGPAPTETYVSRVISSLSAVRSATIQPPAELRDIAQPLNRSQFTTLLQRSPLEAIDPSHIPNLPELAAEPASPSKRFGLNEFTVAVEELPDGGSPDFDWAPLTSVSVTKPSSTPPAQGPTVVTTAVGRAAATTRATTKKAQSTAKTGVSAAGARTTASTDLLTAELLAGPGVQIAPLWEGDVHLPPASKRPRRLVIREHELFFKATPAPNDFLPIARRLVYADLFSLPSAVIS